VRGMDDPHDYLRQLVDRLHRMACISQPVMRVYIRKPGSDKRRPLGIPVIEGYFSTSPSKCEILILPLVLSQLA
jgi:hypothetical protein